MDGVPISKDELNERVTAVVCGFDVHLSWKKIILAANYAARPGTLFVATNMDERFPLKGNGFKLLGPGNTNIFYTSNVIHDGPFHFEELVPW